MFLRKPRHHFPLSRSRCTSVLLRLTSYRSILQIRMSGFPVVSESKPKRGWLWPLGVLATGVAGAAIGVFRGCWHRKMSWPIRVQDRSYQVCMGCGIKRLFDEKAFRAYGPYSYDLNRLIARDIGKPESDVPQRRPA